MKRFKIRETGETITLGDNNFKASGGEGDIYFTSTKTLGDIVAKVCHPGAMIPEGKLLELKAIGHPNIITPDCVIMKGAEVVGYTMKRVPGAPKPLAAILTKQYREREAVTPKTMADLVMKLRVGFKHVHDKQCLIVDANEFNFMVSERHDDLHFIDTASYQTPSYPATAIMNSVRDWSVGKSGDRWQWTKESDWYSFAILSWYLFTGIHPYKARFPDVKVPLADMMVECMKRGRSVIEDVAMFPKGAVYYPFEDYIPGGKSGAFWQWFNAIFVRNERLAPPVDFQAVIAVVSKIKEITGTDKFDIREMFDAMSKVRAYYASRTHEVVVSSNRLYVDRLSYPLPAKKFRVGFSPINDIPVAIYIEDDEVKLLEIVGQKQIKFECTGKNVMSCGGKLFIQGQRDLFEVKLFEKKGHIYMAQPESVFSIMEEATEVFQGCVVMRMLGQYIVGVLPEGRTVKIKELDGYRITEAKYEKGVLMVVGMNRKTNNYDRLVFRFDDDHNAYDLRVIENITPIGINFTVLDNQRCICITEEEAVEITVARKDDTRMTTITDPDVVSDMRLCHNGDKTLVARGEKLYTISVKR